MSVVKVMMSCCATFDFVKQPEVLLIVAEELSDCPLPAVIESEVGDVSDQGYDVMLCNI